jgi:methionyl-tRNA formyltransferase
MGGREYETGIFQATKQGLDVSCADGYLMIEQLQLEGKKRMAAADLIRGLRLL